MAKVLITGGAGYLGSVLIPELLAKGHEVIAVDNFLYNQTSLLDVCHDEKLNVVRGDARDKECIAPLLEGVEYIIPLACIVGAPACKRDPEMARGVNYNAIKMLIELRKPEQRIIFPTTNSGYGIGRENMYCDEKTPLNPISLYGQTKVEAEHAVLEAGNSITFRLATVFGTSPRMRLDLLVNDFVYRAITDRFIVLFEAHFKRNYIHIRDVARAFMHAMENFESMKNEPYNVGLSEANLSKKELCEEIKKHIPDFVFLESNIGEDIDKRNYIVSNEKMEKTGFKPAYTLQQGMSELIKGYQIVKRNQFGNF